MVWCVVMSDRCVVMCDRCGVMCDRCGVMYVHTYCMHVCGILATGDQ